VIVNIRTGTVRIHWLAYLCVLILLAATCLQAVHSCGPQLDSGTAGWHARNASAGFCVVCLRGQTATIAFPPILFSVILIAARPALQEIGTACRLVTFQLHVRPPPVL